MSTVGVEYRSRADERPAPPHDRVEEQAGFVDQDEVGVGVAGYKLKPGDAIRTAAAPRIAGKPFTLTCQIETELRDTIILTHGGSAAGYALQLKEGHVVFSVRTGPKDPVTNVQ